MHSLVNQVIIITFIMVNGDSIVIIIVPVAKADANIRICFFLIRKKNAQKTSFIRIVKSTFVL